MPEQAIRSRSVKLSLTAKILIGLGLGILTGLFFGESAAVLQIVADAYIRLMQMVVLPYLAVALMVGLGQLDLAQARALALRGGALLLLFWAIALLTVFLMSLTFPEWHTGSFFSSTLVEPRKSFNFVELYIPANPFHAMANSVVPAVVVFSAAIGVGLIGVDDKGSLIRGLETFLAALSRVTRFLVGLTPIGVFAISAVAAGTMTLAEFARLQAYFVPFILAALLLSFWVLPALVSTLTHYKYRDILGVSKDALLTAFITNNLFIVIPILIDQSNRLMEQYGAQTKDSSKLVEIIVPVTFNFPTAGKLLTLMFVPFAAWLSGSALELDQYPQFFIMGLASYFAKAQTALPFLMDQLEIPQDLFQLYFPTAIINGKFDTLLAAMNLFAFSLLGTAALSGHLIIKTGRIARYLVITTLVFALTALGTRLFLNAAVDTTQQMAEAMQLMQLSGASVKVTVHKTRPVPPEVSREKGPLTLSDIKSRGVLRVAYEPDDFPFSFFNKQGELVGFDVEMAVRFAEDLGVRLEFIPTRWDSFVGELESGMFDLAPSVPYLPHFFDALELSLPYVEGTAGFVVEDHRRHDFATLDSIRRLPTLTLGVRLPPESVKEVLEKTFPQTAIRLVPLASPRDFFSGGQEGLDALLVAAERGTAWTLLYPDYTVVVPKDDIWRVPMGFAVAEGNVQLAESLDDWVSYSKAEGAVRRAYEYWVLGKGVEQKKRRWSIIHDVLKWGE